MELMLALIFINLSLKFPLLLHVVYCTVNAVLDPISYSNKYYLNPFR